jgi:V/A-type H+/Na+-transporting ATPase subunit I
VILPMQRVEVLGPRDLLPDALAFLQSKRVLDLRAPEASSGAAALLRPAAGEGADAGAVARLSEAVVRCRALADRLPPVPRGPLEPPAQEPLPAPGSPELLARLGQIGAELAALEARRAALLEEREATARFCRLVVALAPIEHRLDAALRPEYHGVVLRSDADALALLRSEVGRITAGTCHVAARPMDEASVGVLIVVPRVHGKALSALLFERGVDEVRLPDAYAGRPLVDVLLLLARRERCIPGELAGAEAALAGRAAALRPALEEVAREAASQLERLAARARCGETRFAFVVSGYMPAEGVPHLAAALEAELGGRATLLAHDPAPGEWGAVPVVLRNRRWVRPFEHLLALVPLPRYGSVDPTPWLAVFFPLFFGFVLGDVAFGLLGIAAALLARARGWGGKTGRDLALVALACSASAAIFGVLFGEALGELGAGLGLSPVLLDRRRAFLKLLRLALALGAVHVGVGMALGVESSLRRGHRREALARAARLLLLASGAAAALAVGGLVSRRVLTPALLSGGAFLLVAVAAEGPLAALDLVLGLGNVLSYARLMALGLASVMLAEVANLVGHTVAPRAFGLGLGVLLHAVNFTLGLISPTVAALRLHYVEFFEKFYDEGGTPYRPFALAPP